MSHFFKKHKFHLMALSLCLFLLACFCLSPFAYKKMYVYRSVAESGYYDALQLEQYYSNSDITSEEIENITDEYTEEYMEYLHFDGQCLFFDIEHAPCETTEMQNAVVMIYNNVQAMNELVDLGAGVIDENYEFVFQGEDEYFQLFRAWGFKLKWNKASACFSGEFAIGMSLFFLIMRLINYAPNQSLSRMLNDLQSESYVQNLMRAAIMDASTALWDDFLSFFIETETILNLVQIVGILSTIIGSANIFVRVVKIVIDLLLPSVTDSLIVLYNAMINGRGAKLTCCWFPWRRDVVGTSLKVI